MGLPIIFSRSVKVQCKEDSASSWCCKSRANAHVPGDSLRLAGLFDVRSSKDD